VEEMSKFQDELRQAMEDYKNESHEESYFNSYRISQQHLENLISRAVPIEALEVLDKEWAEVFSNARQPVICCSKLNKIRKELGLIVRQMIHLPTD
jgi:hypothetical protein